MDQTSAVIVTGTVVHLGPHVVIVPSVPPEPSAPPRMEAQRRRSIAQSQGRAARPTAQSQGGAARPDRWQAGPETTIDDVLAHHTWVVVLHGDDLPPEQERVRAYGQLSGRSLDVRSWSPGPWSTSAWATVDAPGADRETVRAVMAGVLDPVNQWGPPISLGVSETTTGRPVVVLEVDRLSPEIQAWFADQPAGSVKVFPFIEQASAAAPAPPAPSDVSAATT